MARYERTRKGAHLDTVHYEIDMLEYALSRIKPDLPQPEQNMVIECFLLHYRNLIRFFNGKQHRNDDISIARPEVWCSRGLSSEEKQTFETIANSVDDKHFRDISKFLQHCTEVRFHVPKDWSPQKMWEELKPAIELFRNTFPPTHSRNVSGRSAERSRFAMLGGP